MLGLENEVSGTVLDALDTGVVALDGAGRVVAWNAWLAAASGIPAREAAGRRLEDLFPGASLSQLASAVAESLDSGLSRLLTHSLHPALLPLRTRAGRELIHDVSVRPIGRKPYSGCLVQITDVTLAVHRERVLRERQNARYHAVVDSAADAILTLDGDGVIRLANPVAAREFGYDSRELVGQPITVLLGDRESWSEFWQAVLGGKAIHGPVETTARRKDGSSTFLEVSASRWSSDSRVFVTAILRDVSERRAADDALRNLNQTLEQRVAERTAERDRMWRLSTDLMLVARFDAAITAVNPAWTAALGWREDELIGRPFIDLVHPDDVGRTLAEVARLSQGHTTLRFENRCRHKDGSYRWLSWATVPEQGLIHAVARDITAEKAAAAELEQAQEALRQAQKMEAVGQLTGGIAHDFNNLLAGIVGSLDLMQNRLAQGRTADLQRYITAAMTSAQRASALTHRLLAFARRQALAPKSVDVNKLVAGMEDLLRRTIGPGIGLEIVLAGGLWRTFCDPVQLESAILNLCINGRDAMPEGGKLTIETNNAHLDDAYAAAQFDVVPGQYVAVCVTDTGAGMPPDVIARAFDPFFTTKPIGQGTGLGLSMVYGFAKQSEGHVRIYSEPGRGTTVKIYLPRHRGQADEDPIDARYAEPPRAEAGETVLVVEDEPVVRNLIVEVLEDLGYRTLEATDGPSGLKIVQSKYRIDLLITDVGLPGINGRQLADHAREGRPGLKVLFITGYAENATRANGFLEPGMAMLTKPFAVDALAHKIGHMIRGEPLHSRD